MGRGDGQAGGGWQALPAGLRRAWRQTAFEAGGAVARPGRRSAAVDAALARLGVRQGGFLGAANPLSRRMPEGWNARAQARLRAAARRLPALAGHGSGRGWVEPHWLLGGDPRVLLRLARRFRQHGLLLVARGRPARLLALRW